MQIQIQIIETFKQITDSFSDFFSQNQKLTPIEEHQYTICCQLQPNYDTNQKIYVLNLMSLWFSGKPYVGFIVTNVSLASTRNGKLSYFSWHDICMSFNNKTF